MKHRRITRWPNVPEGCRDLCNVGQLATKRKHSPFCSKSELIGLALKVSETYPSLTVNSYIYIYKKKSNKINLIIIQREKKKTSQWQGERESYRFSVTVLVLLKRYESVGCHRLEMTSLRALAI